MSTSRYLRCLAAARERYAPLRDASGAAVRGVLRRRWSEPTDEEVVRQIEAVPTHYSGKPASGTGLDSGNALYSALTAAGCAVWGMLEGSGGTSADSSGNGRTLTLDTSVTWTTIGGDAALAMAGSGGAKALATPSAITLGTGVSFSLAFRCKEVANATYNSISGGTSSALAFYPGLFLYYNPTSGNGQVLSGATDWSNDHDWLLVFDQANTKVHLYQDGVEVSGSPISVGATDGFSDFNQLGSGFSIYPLIGTMTYAYLMNGYAASSTDASNLAANPYSIFASGGGGGPAAGSRLALTGVGH